MSVRTPFNLKPMADFKFFPTLSQPSGRSAESIRSLRAHVMARHVQMGHRALAICAASSHVGCTFIAANLAVAISQVGAHTLLIDGDLRNPRLDKVFGRPDTDVGLHQYLTATESEISEYIEPEVLPNLSVLFAGGTAANPQELLASDRFTALMDLCLRDFDVTIIDTPPANKSSDVSRISNAISYCLIVTRRNRSFVRDVKLLAEQLKADRSCIIGTVFNDG